jgi:flavin reductase (DIM6/NTAB) family NADH-FMN oxidoreductase RutF
MIEVYQSTIYSWDKYYRTNFVNSLNGFKSANLLGSISPTGKSNLSIVSSLVHLGSDPALLGFVCRPTTVPRHTYENLKETGWFTANHVAEDIIRQAHQTSANYPADVSEFAACGLTEVYVQDIPAPFVQEALLRIGLKYEEEYTLKANNTILVVASVQYVCLPGHALESDGLINLEKTKTVAISGLDSYHSTSRLDRFSYAKPDKELRSIG